LYILSQLVRGNDLVVAPVALSPIMARMAEEAGFKAVYLSGGSLGWSKCVTEANVTLTEMAQLSGVIARDAEIAAIRALR
jgi:2-methylisocitrate lyase-like PEP mutase family enzyme